MKNISVVSFSVLILLILQGCTTESDPEPVVNKYTLTVSVTPSEGGTVSPSTSTYDEGKSVSITATPNSEYVFVNWSNSLTDNPLSITVNSNQTVTANFEKRKYPLTVSIIGSGTVSEEIISSGKTTTEYNSGSVIRLTAYPSDEWTFLQWSGAVSSTANPLELTIDEVKTVTAYFEICTNSSQIDLNQSSYDLFDIKFPLLSSGDVNREMSYWLGEEWEYGFGGSYVDYNNDGILDIVGYRNGYSNYIDFNEGYTGYERKQLIRFFIGDCSGNFTPDNLNDNRYYGLVHGRKFLIGDFNNDNYVDFFLIGHGYDKQPFPGEFSKSLISNGEGGYLETDYTSLVSFYHGGTSGDFDNDGDLDIFVTDAGRGKSVIFTNNNGVFSPTTDLIDQNLMVGMFNAEFYDVNKDGFLDIICGGHDWTGNVNGYDNTPLIIFGDGNNYVGNEILRLPESSIGGQGIVTDFNFQDLDGDNVEEIILTRTGDNQTDSSNFYRGWSIQILKKSGNTYVDQTNGFINDFYQSTGQWIKWGHFRDKDNDGKLEFFNTGYPGSSIYLEWELTESGLIRVY